MINSLCHCESIEFLIPLLWVFLYAFPPLHQYPGVVSVETDIETKSVVVTADEKVSPEAMLAQLEKVRPSVLSLSSQIICAAINMDSKTLGNRVSFHHRLQWSKASGNTLGL